MKFAHDLLDIPQFEAVCAKTENGIQVAKDISEFLKKRAEIEQDYAKKLASLCKTAPGVGLLTKVPAVERETRTLKAALLTIQEEGLKISALHLDFGGKILNDVTKPIDGFVKAKEAERKKIVDDGRRKIKTFLDGKVNSDKAKDNYHKLMKDHEVCVEAHEKARGDLAAADNKKNQENEKKAGQRVGPAQEKANQAEQVYRKSVEGANGLLGQLFSEQLPQCLDALQQLEEERYGQLGGALKAFLTLQQAIPAGLEERCVDMATHINFIDTHADLTDFVDANRPASLEHPPIPFVPFKEPAGGPSDAGPSGVDAAPAAPAPVAEPAPAAEPEKKPASEEDIFQ